MNTTFVKNLILTTLVLPKVSRAEGTGFCTDKNGRADREGERGVIYAEVEEMIDWEREGE